MAADKEKPAAMRAAAVQWFLAQQLAEEEKNQGRPLTKNERIAFKCGLYRGMNFDLWACLDASQANPIPSQGTGDANG